MVREIKSPDVAPFVKQVGVKLVPEMKYWAPVNLEVLGNSFDKICGSGMGRAYGLFVQDEPVGLLLGIIAIDLNSGLMQGSEYLWAVQRKFRSRSIPLLRQFEKDCKAAGCKIVLTGSIRSMEPENMRKLYGYLGFQPHGEMFSKRL